LSQNDEFHSFTDEIIGLEAPPNLIGEERNSEIIVQEEFPTVEEVVVDPKFNHTPEEYK
jgi:hypothetical protein